MAFAHALCPIDFSERSREALDLAAALIGPAGRIDMLYVMETPLYSENFDTPAFLESLQERSTRPLECFAAQVRSRIAVVTTRVAFGSPCERTLAAVERDPSIDLVVLGSQGRTVRRSRAPLGSVAERVVRHSPCPVLVVRPVERGSRQVERY
ncbi:MAG: universal stress protein [Deltaproteobacteria bacterium]|nr:universal stress protein [Deltaproteobacteria bacterium]